MKTGVLLTLYNVERTKMTIYQPAEDSYLLQKYVKKHACGRVLDLGTGSGIQAVTAAMVKSVKEVVAVDINPTAVKELKSKRVNKIKVEESDLFSNVKGQFNTIIFNPPYLPQDKVGKEVIEDPTLYGGKKGWEISEKFFNQVSKYLMPEGKVLFLFSSLTNREKIEEIIENNFLEFQQLERIKLPFFEELFVYLIQKSLLLRELGKKGVEDIQYLTHGKRGNIFTGVIDKSKFVKTHFAKKNLVKVGIKVKRQESKAVARIKNEAKWLKVLNKKNIGPKLLFYGDDYLVYEFVEGMFILDFIKKENSEKLMKSVLVKILEQCYELDKLAVNKEEMHHPLKHIIIGKNNKPTLIDFERCHKTDKPHNVTQFVEFICRIQRNNVQFLRELAREYKNNLNKENLDKIIAVIQ